jgi:Protein of unknown function (DUF3618)
MGRQSEQLEREAEGVRSELSGSLAELRFRLTPGQIVDQLTDYAREGPAADFLNNLAREIRETPMPVLLIAIGIAWLVLATNRRSGTPSRFDDRDVRTALQDEIGSDLITQVEASPEDRSTWAVVDG